MNKEVTLNYDKAPDGKATFRPDPATVRLNVSQGDTVSFKLGRGPDNGKIKVTFNEPQFFARSQFNHGEGAVAAKPGLKKRTTYRCELFVNGALEASGDGASGGAIEPAGGDG